MVNKRQVFFIFRKTCFHTSTQILFSAYSFKYAPHKSEIMKTSMPLDTQIDKICVNNEIVGKKAYFIVIVYKQYRCQVQN